MKNKIFAISILIFLIPLVALGQSALDYLKPDFGRKIGVCSVCNMDVFEKMMTSVSILKKAIAVGALLYFILPLDSIPDLTPIVGFLDDIGIVVMVVKYLSDEIKRYY